MHRLEQNFKYFALYYLNDWCIADRGFIDGLSLSKSWNDRLSCIRTIMNYYGVGRTLRKTDENERLGDALKILDAVSQTITEDNVDSVVCGLADSLKSAYRGVYPISAASKLLWIKLKSPIVIYDSRAIACLNKAAGIKLYGGYYKPYRKEWLKQFAELEHSIRAACADLVRVKEFSRAYAMPEDEFA